MKINGVEVIGNKFAYDGCHKIYVIEDQEDEQQVRDSGYKILDISQLMETYEYSCELRYIRNWKSDKRYVDQFENATFEIDGQTFVITTDDVHEIDNGFAMFFFKYLSYMAEKLDS